MLESITVKYLENHPTDMQFYHFFESISKKINGQQLYLCLNMLANVFAQKNGKPQWASFTELLLNILMIKKKELQTDTQFQFTKLILKMSRILAEEFDLQTQIKNNLIKIINFLLESN